MTDEERARTLLRLAAELPDLTPGPAGNLVARARHARRMRRVRLGALSVVAVAAVAAGTIVVQRGAGGSGGTWPALPMHPVVAAPNQWGTAAALTRDHWSVLARSPLGRRSSPEVAWTGTELLEIGGWSGGAVHGDGAAFSPRNDTWRRIAPAPASIGTWGAVSAWTGSRLFVFGGKTVSGSSSSVAGLYDPSSNTWTITSPAPLPAGWVAAEPPFPADSQQMTALWTGGLVVVAGLAHRTIEVASYDPAANAWHRDDPPLPPRHRALQFSMAATASRVLVWSQWSWWNQTTSGGTSHSGVDVLAADASGRWQNVTGHWPQHETVQMSVYTGSQLIIPPGQYWCGECSFSPPLAGHGGGPGGPPHSSLANPRTLRLTALPHEPADKDQPFVVWTGSALISFDTCCRPFTMAAWMPSAGRWRELPRAPLSVPPGAYSRPTSQAPTANESAFWAGRELLAIAADGHVIAFGR